MTAVKKKARLEIIEPEFGSSFSIKQYKEANTDQNNYFWHFHPELEIVYVKGGSGKRHIGNHLSYYMDGELLLIGSNLPHLGFTDRHSRNESETIIQIKTDFLGENFFDMPETSDIKKLFERAKYGISFLGESKYHIGQKIEQIPELDKFDRLIALLEVLKDMAESSQYQMLNATEYSFEVPTEDNERPEMIYAFVRERFLETITLEEIASHVNMTVPAFCRYFKKLSSKTFTRFVNEYRIVHACKLIAEQKISITEVCYQSGFNNFSHFTKLFKEVTGESPSKYRKAIKTFV
ncbi:MAG: helix-turn-helix transcriptional regulator [Saprospiraceae bacterium]|nr:helix-turn-helix transcriptional regulator [Saprospiraceae bacterium]NNK89394.1 helix-turn-helix transcriptional regulator [Saprospiraceae bacterium]